MDLTLGPLGLAVFTRSFFSLEHVFTRYPPLALRVAYALLAIRPASARSSCLFLSTHTLFTGTLRGLWTLAAGLAFLCTEYILYTT
ncbi:uncharacterized protein SCHCODRAFT_01262236 [Schizophyllum commune H4-8]|uniref:uncharacterized protein n=1 Tax=Schizophyllum commune (strain H4-8 / FGSC 9210) TaxID=578458 RepID=UPI00215F55E5|nr:uncharacterized protein SCHCODRAFT_01262236 [Schizophyllum commune H4-8]KAI5886557.1 hypothetical protein SCHCODRAFT_01262236 [Schizophyllum commune H4-8]